MPIGRSQPNVVIIMTDQQRADFSAEEGFPLDTTPTIDQLGRSGVRFDKAYTSSPVCVPARCSMMTGRFISAHGIRGNYETREIRYNKDLVDVLREAGYKRLLVGKNHSHLTEERFDLFRTYSHSYGPIRPGQEEQDTAFNEWMDRLAHWISEEPTPFPLEEQYPVRIVDESIEYLKEIGSEPFFLWMSFPEPHNPFQVPAPYFDMFPPEDVPERAAGPEVIKRRNYQWRFELDLIRHYYPDCEGLWRRYRSNYCGMLRLIDDQLGQFFDFLNKSKLRENTIVVYLSDHGEYVADYGLYRKGVGLGECLTRTPFIWSGPGIKPHDGFHPAHVSIVDVMPTLCDALGLEIPFGVQGRSLWPLLTGGEYPKEEFESIYAEHGFGGEVYTPDDKVDFEGPTFIINMKSGAKTFQELNNVTQSGNRKMVRKGRWKLVYDLHLGGELYDLEEDPAELKNLFGEEKYRDVQEELLQELLRWTIRVEDPLPLDRYTAVRTSHNWSRIK